MNNPLFQKVEIVNGLVVLAAAAVGFIGFSSEVGLGLTVGALLMGINFFILRRLTSFILAGTPKKAGIAIALLMIKLLLFFAAVWVAMTYLPMNTLAFGLGAAIILLSVTLTTTFAKKTEAEE